MKLLQRALPLLLCTTAAHAQTVPGGILQAPAVVVEETLLSADASGVTRVRFEASTPAGSQTPGHLAARVASLHISTGGAGSFGDLVTLRGLPNTPYFSDPSVTVYFDDLPLGNVFTYPTALFGFAHATILRGPQATSLGRGGEAGALLFSSTEPGSAAAGELRAGVGNFNQHAIAFDARSARGDRADATVSGSFLERDGYVDNRTLDRRVDDRLDYSAAARLRFRPTETTELTLQLLGQRRRDGAQPLVPLGGPMFSVGRTREGSTDSDFLGAALKAGFEIELGQLTSTTSRTEWELAPYDNRLVLPPPLDSRIDQSQRIWNEELRLDSGRQSFVTWHAGLWFSQSETDGEIDRAIPGLFPVEASSFALRSRTLAFFSEATVPPNIGWRLTAGLRLETTTREFDRAQRVPAPERFDRSRTFRAALPKVSASYTFTNEVTASATIALGTKPGGWSAYTGNAALAGFRAEKLAAFEAGLDTTLADKTVTLAARGFLYAIRDYQIERSFNPTDYLVVNAPRARSIGGEIEASWRPREGLSFTAAISATRIELRRFTDPFTGRSLSGRRAPYAPEFEVHVGATYRTPAGFFAAGEFVAIGETFFDESENHAFAAERHVTLQARAGYENARWRLTLYGENLADERYHALIIPGVGHGVPGAPRTWGVEAGLKW